MAGSDSVEELKRQLREKEQVIQGQNQLLQNSTMLELLTACHKYFDSHFTVEANPKKTTAGTITKPEGRKHPSWLKPWLDFPRLQSDTFQSVLDTLHPPNSPPKRVFWKLNTIQDLAEGIEGMTIASEPDLRNWQNRYIDPVVGRLCAALGANVNYSTTSHALKPDVSHQETAIPPTDLPRPAPGPVYADQFCVYRSSQGDEQRLAHVVELKAPHKMRGHVLRNSVMAEAIIDVVKVRDRYDIPITEPEKTIHYGRRLIATATAQIYDYMLDCACSYGCIVTGETMIFLKIDEVDTTILHYHIADPFREAGGTNGQSFEPSKTSVAQAVIFFLIASSSAPHGQDWVREAKAAAPVWIVDHDKVPHEKTPTKRRRMLDNLDREDFSYSMPRTSPSNRSPVKTRSRYQQSCKPAVQGAAKDDQESDDDDNEQPYTRALQSEGPTATKTVVQGGQQSQEASYGQASSQEQQKRSYCTQACMLGLVQQGPIDDTCPNARLHPRVEGGDLHALTNNKLCELIRQQLAHTMNYDIEDLGLQGARGMVFKLFLVTHGYTFIGKATTSFYVPELIHEERVYQRLGALQGSLVPVCLGSIELVHPWYCPGTQLVHMLLLSYGGEPIWEIPAGDEPRVGQFVTALRARGVRHGDTRPENMLWNRELGQLMFVDFERSSITSEDSSDVSIPTRGTNKRKAVEEWKPFYDELDGTTRIRC